MRSDVEDQEGGEVRGLRRRHRPSATPVRLRHDSKSQERMGTYISLSLCVCVWWGGGDDALKRTTKKNRVWRNDEQKTPSVLLLAHVLFLKV